MELFFFLWCNVSNFTEWKWRVSVLHYESKLSQITELVSTCTLHKRLIKDYEKGIDFPRAQESRRLSGSSWLYTCSAGNMMTHYAPSIAACASCNFWINPLLHNKRKLPWTTPLQMKIKLSLCSSITPWRRSGEWRCSSMHS